MPILWQYTRANTEYVSISGIIGSIVKRLLRSAPSYSPGSDAEHRSKVLSIILGTSRALPHIVSWNRAKLITSYTNSRHLSQTICADELCVYNQDVLSRCLKLGLILNAAVLTSLSLVCADLIRSYPVSYVTWTYRAFFSQACIPLFILTVGYISIRAPPVPSMNGKQSERSRSTRDQRKAILQNCLLLFMTCVIQIPVLAWQVKHWILLMLIIFLKHVVINQLIDTHSILIRRFYTPATPLTIRYGG